MSNKCYTFKMQAGTDDVQEAIDQDNQAAPGYIIAEIPAVHTRGYEDVTAGDGAVIECSDEGCGCCWIGDIEEVERTPSVTRVLIRVR